MRVLSLIVFLLVAAPGIAAACTCPVPPEPSAAFDASAAVFTGHVTHVIHLADGRILVQIERNTVWSGPTDEYVLVRTRSPRACGVSFRAGQDWLVYATEDIDGVLTASSCGRSRQAAGAEDDYASLGEGTPIEHGERSLEILERAAHLIAVEAAVDLLEGDRAREATIEMIEGNWVVTFPYPLEEGERGPDYYAQVTVDGDTGEVLQVLAGS